MYKVTVEWDGEKPPTTFYNRMRSLGLKVRGDKDLSPIQRRVGTSVRGTAVIVQEGSILCESESLARVIYQYARDQGAEYIQLEQVYPVEFSLTTEDAKIYQRLEASLGRRGRPAGISQDFVVTCMEEPNTYEVLDVRNVPNCPGCHGVRIKTRVGTMSSYKFPPAQDPNNTQADIFDRWFRHRFASGEFEIPGDDTVLPPASRDIEVNIVKEKRGVEMLKNSPKLIDELKYLDEDTAVDVLDAVFSARTSISETARKEGRVRACLKLYERGVSSDAVSVLENPQEAELLDGASILNENVCAAFWMRIQKAKKENDNE